jgi:hypothetical protein
MADGAKYPFGLSPKEYAHQIAAMKRYTGESEGAAGGENASAEKGAAPSSFARLLAEALKGPAAPASVGNASIDAIIRDGGGSRVNEEIDGNCFYRAIARQFLGNHERYPEMRLKTAKMFASIAGKQIITEELAGGIERPVLREGKLQFQDLVIEGTEPDEAAALFLQEQDTFNQRGNREECVSAILTYERPRAPAVDSAKLKYTKEQAAEQKRLSNAIAKIESKKGVPSEKNQLNRNLLSSQLIELQSQAAAAHLESELGFDPTNVQEVLLTYANYVATTTLWAGQVEAYYLAPVLDRNIIWFDLTVGSIPKLRYFKVPNEPGDSDLTSQPIVVAWSGGNHYESILPPEGGWKREQLTRLYASEGGHGGGRRRTRRRRRA